MKLEHHYNELWKLALQKFSKNKFELDPFVDSARDTRYGVSLLARPSEEVKQNISGALEKIEAVAPNQYYYPDSDLHITILTIISCYTGFSLNEIEQSEYQKIVRSAVNSISPIKIQFRGLTASPSCILVQGFPEDNQLETLRNNLRNSFNQSKLQYSIDERYRLQTAHITVIRFKKPFLEAEKFIKTVSDFRDYNFGSCVIEQLELVGNDWYQKKDKVKLINEFNLSKR